MDINKLAISSDSDFVKTFSDMDKDLGMAIGITYLEKYKPEEIKLLFIAEALPKIESNRFFYYEDVFKQLLMRL